MYSNVLRELSSQEISLSMAEASSLSNVRIINNASVATKISPRFVVYIFSIIILFISYGILLLRHFLGDKITNFDSLVDFVSKEKIIGELPEISKILKLMKMLILILLMNFSTKLFMKLRMTVILEIHLQLQF